jgi:hypothetical protein
MLYACGKRYYVCVTCMLWYSDTELCSYWCSTYMTLFGTYSVCTSMYRSVLILISCSEYVLIRTASESVRTKYPVPVMHVTIPDEGRLSSTVTSHHHDQFLLPSDDAYFIQDHNLFWSLVPESPSVNMPLHMCSYRILVSYMHVFCSYIQSKYKHI